MYARMPWLFGPLFVAESPFRLWRELAATFPRPVDRFRFGNAAGRSDGAHVADAHGGARSHDLDDRSLDDCRRIQAPTLVITGESDLDHVVPAQGGSDYTRLIPGARSAVLERTGHLGSIARPREFARLVEEFVTSAERESLRSRMSSTQRGGAPRADKNDAA
jgi:pimeloyl-ACP methyl ester carboxylesterase